MESTMAFVSTYLNFMGQTEEAFTFYAQTFQSEETLKMTRFSEMPAMPGAPHIPDHEMNLVMHAELRITAGHTLMATDMLKSMGHEVRIGNNTTINLNLDTRSDADHLFGILSEGATEMAGMMEMPFGYWGVALDKYGIRWMFNVA
jgi:PhnB protein